MADRGVSVVTDRLDGLSDKMSGSTGKAVKNMAEGDSAPKAALKAGVESVKDTGLKGVSTIKDKVSEAVGGGDGDKGKDKKLKFTNIVEELDLPVPPPSGVPGLDSVRGIPHLPEEGRERRTTGGRDR